MSWVKSVRRLFDVQPSFIFILAQVRVMPATVMVGSDIAASRVPLGSQNTSLA